MNTQIFLYTHSKWIIIPVQHIKFFSNEGFMLFNIDGEKKIGWEMVRKMFLLLIARAGYEESRGGILLWEVLASQHAFWIRDMLVENCCRRSMHIHINERKEQAREKREREKAWSLTEETALWKVGLGKIESSKTHTFRPQNESATCRYERVVN